MQEAGQVWKKRAEDMFALLDNIDTASDIAKDDHVAYRRLVQKQLDKLREHVEVRSDDTLLWKR